MKLIKTKVADVTSKVVCGSEGCIGWMTNIVVIGSERYKYESMSGGVTVNFIKFEKKIVKALCRFLR